MHEFGNYLGTLEFAAMPVEIDFEYIEHLQKLSHEELIEGAINLQAQIEVLNNLRLDR